MLTQRRIRCHCVTEMEKDGAFSLYRWMKQSLMSNAAHSTSFYHHPLSPTISGQQLLPRSPQWVAYLRMCCDRSQVRRESGVTSSRNGFWFVPESRSHSRRCRVLRGFPSDPTSRWCVYMRRIRYNRPSWYRICRVERTLQSERK